jgi:hypothetical protein
VWRSVKLKNCRTPKRHLNMSGVSEGFVNPLYRGGGPTRNSSTTIAAEVELSSQLVGGPAASSSPSGAPAVAASSVRSLLKKQGSEVTALTVAKSTEDLVKHLLEVIY